MDRKTTFVSVPANSCFFTSLPFSLEIEANKQKQKVLLVLLFLKPQQFSCASKFKWNKKHICFHSCYNLLFSLKIKQTKAAGPDVFYSSYNTTIVLTFANLTFPERQYLLLFLLIFLNGGTSISLFLHISKLISNKTKPKAKNKNTDVKLVVKKKLAKPLSWTFPIPGRSPDLWSTNTGDFFPDGNNFTIPTVTRFVICWTMLRICCYHRNGNLFEWTQWHDSNYNFS